MKLPFQIAAVQRSGSRARFAFVGIDQVALTQNTGIYPSGPVCNCANNQGQVQNYTTCTTGQKCFCKSGFAPQCE